MQTIKLEGIGRKIFIRYEKHVDINDQETIFEFLLDECYLTEGQFVNDKLKGFGRICSK